MKKGFKITAIVIGVILILMFLLPFAFRGKIEGIVKSEGNKMLNGHFDFSSLDISLFRNFPKASVTLNDPLAELSQRILDSANGLVVFVVNVL